MDDMTAFERQVAGEFVRRAGPVRPVDAAAIFTATTATQSPQWRFQSMFSATKFVVAGVIVALFGGFLLAGVLTQPSDEMAPAAVSVSPSTSPDLLPGVDLVSEEVEPGVERIVSDGVRDLSGVGRRRLGPAPPDGLAVAPDGTVWLRTGSTLIKLGDPDSFPVPSAWPDLKVSPDGTLWGRTGSATSIGRLEGDGWAEMAELDTRMDSNAYWDFAPDGTVWTGRSQARVARLDASGWQDYPIDLDSFDLDLQQLSEAYGDDTAGQRPYFEDLRVGANGDVWAALSVNDGAFASMILLRYDGEAWSVEDPLGLGGYYTVDLLDVGPDGTVWVYLEAGRDARNEPEGHYLARLADDRWTVFSEEDGVEQLVWRAENYGLLRVDHDGAVWVRPQDPVPQDQGVRVFDGKTWRQYLDGHDVIDMEVAPDGRVWVLASDHLYRITPEAVAAADSMAESSPSEEPTANDTSTSALDLLPGVNLVTEEVESGVFRVLDDGTDNDMGQVAFLPHGSSQVVAGQDGSVWVRRGQPPGEDRLFRLGVLGSVDAQYHVRR